MKKSEHEEAKDVIGYLVVGGSIILTLIGFAICMLGGAVQSQFLQEFGGIIGAIGLLPLVIVLGIGLFILFIGDDSAQSSSSSWEEQKKQDREEEEYRRWVQLIRWTNDPNTRYH